MLQSEAKKKKVNWGSVNSRVNKLLEGPGRFILHPPLLHLHPLPLLCSALWHQLFTHVFILGWFLVPAILMLKIQR